MKYKELIILLPCHSLEDFPTHHEGEEAQGLLANWSALWHPVLLASADGMPTWYRADSPPEDLTNKLIVVPGVSESELPTGFAQRAEADEACLIRDRLDRDEIVGMALAGLDDPRRDVDLALVADFLALGYCYLQVELLTRQMRYSSNLDEIHFQTQLTAAAAAAVEGDQQETHERLSACFDTLAEERDHYYPVDAYIVDLTLLAPSTIGQSLREQLAGSIPSNLLLSGELLALIAETEPETLAAIRHALDREAVGIVGGEESERRLPIVSSETILYQLRGGIARYESLLGHRPAVYGRRRYGLTPALPQVLQKLGFEAALHATMEEGVFPEGSQMKIRWEGCDGTSLDAIGRPPLDAHKADAYLGYAVKLGEALDMDHVATVCFAHWPGQTSPWYEDLRRIARYSPVLGKFLTLDQYFRETDVPVHQDRFEADRYRSPYLTQAVSRDHLNPISSSIQYWRRRAIGEAAQSLETLTVLVAGKGLEGASGRDESNTAAPCELLAAIDEAAGEGDEQATDQRLDATLQNAVKLFAETLPRRSDAAETGYLVANPHSFARRIGVHTPDLESPPTIERPVYAASNSGRATHAVVDVPPMGFVWVEPGGRQGRSKKVQQSLADECILRNEFLEALIDPTTGALRALHDYESRGNRLSQRIVFQPGRPKRRSQDADVPPAYSVMAADSIETTVATPALGEIVARGRLVNRQGKPLASFQQTYRIWRGSRVLEVEIELDPQTECKPDPWNSYYAVRSAWATESADLWRAVNQMRQKATAKRFEAPHYIEIDEVANRTTILTGGLPFHRLVGHRMLDSLLVVRGEQCRHFRMGIGVNLKHPLQEALSLLTPETMIRQAASPPSPADSGWLFHVDSRNVIATHWAPLGEGDEVSGFRVRLLETGGRAAKTKLSSFRPVASARQVDFCGETRADCQLADGQIQLGLGAHEWVEVEARW